MVVSEIKPCPDFRVLPLSMKRRGKYSRALVNDPGPKSWSGNVRQTTSKDDVPGVTDKLTDRADYSASPTTAQFSRVAMAGGRIDLARGKLPLVQVYRFRSLMEPRPNGGAGRHNASMS